jgi:hypothetical protein
VRSVTKPLAQGALLFSLGFYGLLFVEAGLERTQHSAQTLYPIDLALRAWFGVFTLLLVMFVVVSGGRWLARRRTEPLSGLGEGVLYGAAALLLALPFALGSACRSFEQRGTLAGRVFFFSLDVAMDGDGTARIYECDALALSCAVRSSQPFTPQDGMLGAADLTIDRRQRTVAVSYRGQPLLGYSLPAGR